MSDKTGRLFVVSGPSGAGIGDVMKKTIESREDIGFIIPVTARKMKAGEENGVGFYFYDLEGWDALAAEGDLLECTEFAGNDYGTSRRQVNEQTAQGKNVLLNLELSRAGQIKKNMPEAVCIFMIPRSREELEKRYQATARNRFEVPIRMEEAQRQQEDSSFCDYIVYSDDLDEAAGELSRIMDAESNTFAANAKIVEELKK